MFADQYCQCDECLACLDELIDSIVFNNDFCDLMENLSVNKWNKVFIIYFSSYFRKTSYEGKESDSEVVEEVEDGKIRF